MTQDSAVPILDGVEVAQRQNFELETKLLASIMQEPGAYRAAAVHLRPEHFYFPQHEDLFRLMGELTADGSPPDRHVLTAALEERKLLENVGGWQFVYNVLGEWTVVSAAGVEWFARRLLNLGLQRQAQDGMLRILQDIEKRNTPAADVAAALQSLSAALIGQMPLEIDDADLDAAMETLGQELAAAIDSHRMIGWTTGFSRIDELSGSYRRGELWILAGRQNIGKSRVSGYSAVACAKSGARVLYCAPEMRRGIMPYLVSSASTAMGYSFNSRVLREPSRYPDAKDQIAEAFEHAGRLKEYLRPVFAGCDSVDQIRRVLQSLECDVLFVDQAQALDELQVADPERRRAAIPVVLNGLRRLAQEFGCCVVLMHQISRQGVDRPQLHHLADSDEFGKIPDYVLGVHDPQTSCITAHGAFAVENGLPVPPDSRKRNETLYTRIESQRPIIVDLLKSRNEKDGETALFDYATGTVLR